LLYKLASIFIDRALLSRTVITYGNGNPESPRRKAEGKQGLPGPQGGLFDNTMLLFSC